MYSILIKKPTRVQSNHAVNVTDISEWQFGVIFCEIYPLETENIQFPPPDIPTQTQRKIWVLCWERRKMLSASQWLISKWKPPKFFQPQTTQTTPAPFDFSRGANETKQTIEGMAFRRQRARVRYGVWMCKQSCLWDVKSVHISLALTGAHYAMMCY